MNKIFYFVLILTFSLCSQTNTVLVIHPNGSKYKKVELAIKADLNNRMNIRSLVSKNETEILNTISNCSPKIVIVMDMELIRTWKKIQQKHLDISQIPSILIENEFFNKYMDNLSNSCIISYEPKLEQYIERVIHLTGNKPSNIGIVFSSKSKDLVQSYQNESIQLKTNLHVKSVIISDPENSIKTIVKNFIEHYNVDFMIIVNDHVVINNQNINTTWLPLLEPLKVPIAVPSDYFYELEPRIGSFAIQPHYSEIGREIASVINDAEGNGWIINQKSLYTDKSVFYFRNKDGSISQQNQLQNKAVASFHPKTRNDLKEQIAVKSEPLLDTQQKLVSEERPLYESVDLKKNSVPPSIDSVVEIKEKTVAKPVVSIASNNNKNVTNKKSDLSPTKVITNIKPKKDQPEATSNSNVTKRTLQPTVLSEVHPSKDQTFHFIASKNEKYDIEITTVTASIYKELTAALPILGVGKSGDILNVMSEDSLWYCVDFFGTQGFLSKTEARKFIQENYIAKTTWYNQLSVIIAVIVLIVISFFIYVFLKSAKSNKVNRINCLLITRKGKRIKYSNINNKHISLVKYLKNYGFHIMKSKNLARTSDLLLFNSPDIICVDWQFEIDIQAKIYEILKDRMSTADFILIFYNIVDSSSIEKNNDFDDHTFFFTKKFTISDLNNVISIVKIKSESPQLSEQSDSHLEGKITEDTLTEIFQLMDINKKTGCLHLENRHPVGMLFFEEGIITYAVTNTLIAEDAVFDILSMKHGRFKFVPGKKPVARQMELNIVAVLMEKAQLIDEIPTLS